MMKRVAAALGLTMLLAVGASHAADLAQPPRHQMYTKAPLYTPAPVFTWQGLYAGINGGYGWASSTLSGPGGSNDITPSGALAGVQLGYNMQSGSLVYGLEGDIDYSWLKKSADLVAPCPGCELRNHYLATLRGRLGYSFGQWMPYITGGAAIGDIQFYTPAGGAQAIDKFGWTVGGGVEYAFGFSKWSAKLEYLYADLGSATCDATHCGVPIDADMRANIVRAGINLRY
jgi:outer membrane immunogenic protein